MRFNQGISIVLVVILLAFLPTDQVNSALIRISIPEEVSISTPWITLGDIAVIEGISGEKLAELQAINLGKALLPGYSLEIPRQQIELILQGQGLDGKDFKLDIPERVLVRTTSRRLAGEQLINKAKEYLIGLIDYPTERIVIRARFIPPEIILPDRDYDLRFEISGGTKLRGAVSLQALIIIDELVYQKVFLGFEILVKHQVYIAKRPIKIGEKLVQVDFYQDYRELGDFRGDLITDWRVALVQDGVVKLAIPQGGILTSYYLSLPVLIRAGEQIQAELVFGNVQVKTMVRARQSGKKGQYITVENLKTGHKFKAQVINAHLVRLVQ